MEEAQIVDRRATDALPGRDETEIVRQALILQHTSGTPCAVEYLMARGIHGATVRRVLSGGLRADDQEAILLSLRAPAQ